MVCVLWGITGLAAPSRADAYSGEADVVTGASLSKEIEELVKVPDFIPKGWEGGGGAEPPADESAWTDFWEGSGAFPITSTIIGGFSLGFAIGGVICNEILELEGCWYYGSKGADEFGGKSGWGWEEAHTMLQEHGVTIYPYELYWSTGTSPITGLWYEPCDSSDKPPSDAIVRMGTATGECYSSPKYYPGPYSSNLRYQQSNREMKGMTKGEASGFERSKTAEYCGESGGCGSKPSSKWAEHAATCLKSPHLCGMTETQRNEIGEHMASETPKGEAEHIHDPWRYYKTVPNCVGVYSECAAELEADSLEPDHISKTWEHAVITKPAEAVVETKPAGGTELIIHTKVEVVTNPDEAHMPVVIPEVHAGETYSEYASKLNPALEPHKEYLPEGEIDPHVGPNDAVRTTPEAGTEENPETTTEVKVWTNPEDAPPVAGGWTPPTVPSLDLSPLETIGNPCSVFPFGAVCWVADTLTSWSEHEANCPDFSIPVGQGTGVDKKGEVGFNTCQIEPVMEVVRPIIVALSLMTIGVWVSGWSLGTSAPSGSDD